MIRIAKPENFMLVSPSKQQVGVRTTALMEGRTSKRSGCYSSYRRAGVQILQSSHRSTRLSKLIPVGDDCLQFVLFDMPRES
jgi:hypothetical protein